MARIAARVRAFVTAEQGQATTEYVIVVALIVTVVGVVLGTTGVFGDLATYFSGALN